MAFSASIPALFSRVTWSPKFRASTMWKARSPRLKPSWMNGIRVRYISSGVWKKAQIWRYSPSGVPAKVIGSGIDAPPGRSESHVESHRCKYLLKGFSIKEAHTHKFRRRMFDAPVAYQSNRSKLQGCNGNQRKERCNTTIFHITRM